MTNKATKGNSRLNAVIDYLVIPSIITITFQHYDNVNYLWYILQHTVIFHTAMPQAFRHSTLHASLQCVNTHYVNKTHFHNRFALVTSRRLKRSCTLDFLFFTEKWFEIVFLFLHFSWLLCSCVEETLPAPPPPDLAHCPAPPLQKKLTCSHALSRCSELWWRHTFSRGMLQEAQDFSRCCFGIICDVAGDLRPPVTLEDKKIKGFEIKFYVFFSFTIQF